MFMTNEIFEPHRSNKPCLFEHKKKELGLEQYNQQIQANLTPLSNINNIERLTSFDSYTNRTFQSRNINPNIWIFFEKIILVLKYKFTWTQKIIIVNFD